MGRAGTLPHRCREAPGEAVPAPSSPARRLARLEVGALCVVLVLLAAVIALSRLAGAEVQADHPRHADRAVAMKAAADRTPWTFTPDEALAYGEQACADLGDPRYDGPGGFDTAVRTAWVALGLDPHGVSGAEQLEHHRRLHAEAVRTLCPELRWQVPPAHR